jgi:hypothetical protein
MLFVKKTYNPWKSHSESVCRTDCERCEYKLPKLRALNKWAVARPSSASPPHVVVLEFAHGKRGVNFFYFFVDFAVVCSQAFLFYFNDIFDNFCFLLVLHVWSLCFVDFFFFWYLSKNNRVLSDDLILLNRLRCLLLFFCHSIFWSTCLPSPLVGVLGWISIFLQ